jgi:hypothetical protein
MDALLLAEDSDTISSEAELVKNYYQGQFIKIASLTEELSEYSSTDLCVLSEDYGLIHGSDEVSTLSEQDRMQGLNDASEFLTNQVSNYDIVILLLTTEVFEDVVAENWDTLVRKTKPDSVWCIGVARSGLENCDIDALRQKVEKLIIYQRVGVAPISNDTKDELLEKVSSK